MSRKPPPPESEAASARLKRLWLKEKARLDISQLDLAGDMGISQGAVGQYLNGYIALNVNAVSLFCVILNANPQEIYPELFKKHSGAFAALSGAAESSAPYVDKDTEEIRELWRSLTHGERVNVKTYMTMIRDERLEKQSRSRSTASKSSSGLRRLQAGQ